MSRYVVLVSIVSAAMVVGVAAAAPGKLDPGFGNGGVVVTATAPGEGEDGQNGLAIQRDHRVVVGGSSDMGASAGGKVTTAVGPGTRRDRAHDVAVLADGKIVVAGFADMGPGAGGRNFMLARYNRDGTLDGSFGSGGIVITRVAPGDNRDVVTTNGLTIADSGRFILSGQANMGAGAGGFNFALARYNPDGTLDGSFGSGGIVTTAVAPGDNFDTASSIGIDRAGKIVAGGIARSGGFAFDWALVRYNPDGSLDNSFGAGGKVTTNVGPGNTDDDQEELVIGSTGKILIGGSVAPTALGVDSDFAVARYNDDGTLDGSFGGGGIVTTNTAAANGDDEIFEIALQSDAKLIASGECVQPATGRDVCVARYKVGVSD